MYMILYKIHTVKPTINAPPYILNLMFGCIFTFLATSRLKMARFSFSKKLLEGDNVPLKTTMTANAYRRLLGVLRYLGFLGRLCNSIFITPGISDGCNSFGIVCVSHSQRRTDKRTALNFGM